MKSQALSVVARTPQTAQAAQQEQHMIPTATAASSVVLSKPMPAQYLSAASAEKVTQALNAGNNCVKELMADELLSDCTIDLYLKLIANRMSADGNNVFAFKVYFFELLVPYGYDIVKESNENEDIFSQRYLLVPVCVRGGHWTIIITDIFERKISYYDSTYNPRHQDEVSRLLTKMRKYLEEHHLATKGTPLEIFATTIEQSIPKQVNNTKDCGIFICQYAEHLTRNAPLLFTQDDMVRFRASMATELANSALAHQL